ncbi:MAG TPA: hypothetical protein VEQ11_18090 [Chloroflexota bacterium]|nr:hypothetical protein [Chloroflexota bacterium]
MLGEFGRDVVRVSGSGLAALRARPAVVVLILAVGGGSAAGLWLAGRFPPRRSGRRDLGPILDRVDGAGRVGKQARAGIALFPIAFRLASNPIVQHLVRRAISRQINRRLGRT